MLSLLLQSSLPTPHPLTLLVISTVVGLAVALFWKRYDARVALAKSKQDAENIWRQARLDAEQGLRDELKKETAARVQWQLENDADIARIVDIMKESNETQKLTATLAADSKHHSTELIRINGRMENIGQQLNDFIARHVKP